MINFNKPIQTKAGYPVRLYAFDGAGDYPIHGAYMGPQKQWWIQHWNKYGVSYYSLNSSLDLINTPEPEETWQLLVFRSSNPEQLRCCMVKDIQSIGSDCIARIPITFRPGDGLDKP